MKEFAFTLDPSSTVSIVLGVVMPLLVALVTKQVTGSGTKAVLLAVLTLVTTIITGLGVAINNHGTFDLGLALQAAVPQFIISVALHFGLWRPTGISEKLQSVGSN